MNRKYSRVQKNRRRRKNTRAKRGSIISIRLAVLVILVIFLLSFIYAYFAKNTHEKYDGLGNRNSYPLNNYDMNSFFRNDSNMKAYDDGKVRGIPGIDVSEHQGEINWTEVKDFGVRFAMIRLGYSSHGDGSIHDDAQYERNIKQCADKGIIAGIYFFSQAVTVDEAEKEANYVADRIRNERIKGPVAFDMEYVGDYDRINTLDKIQRTKIADAFCTVIKKRGYKAMIYTNPSWVDESLDLSYLTDFDIWLAQYNEYPTFDYQFIMWQYSESGTIPGINTPVDLNIYFQ